MPSYDFTCRTCDHTFEALLRSHREAPPTCPQCGQTTERQLNSVSARSADGVTMDLLQARAAAASAGVSPCGRCGDPAGSCQTR